LHSFLLDLLPQSHLTLLPGLHLLSYDLSNLHLQILQLLMLILHQVILLSPLQFNLVLNLNKLVLEQVEALVRVVVVLTKPSMQSAQSVL